MATDRPFPLPPPSAAAFPVFIDSNLDTHLAMAVSPDDTVADIKRKIRIEHAICFPDVGEITVLALKVKRRGAFYHLSDTMFVKSAFDGSKGTWFLHVDAVAASISKHQGETTEFFVNESREHLDGNRQLIVGPSQNLDQDESLARENISIDDRSIVHEKHSELADHVDLSKPKTGSCQIESLIDTPSDQLAAGNHNADESTQMHQLERSKVNNENQVHESDGWVKETAKLPEELPSKLPDGDSSLLEHLTDDKKKKRKKRRSSKSQQTEVDSATPLHKHDEPYTEHGPALEKSDAIGLVPEAREGNNEGTILTNHKDLVKKFENVVGRDTVELDTSSKKFDVSGFSSESMEKGLPSNHISGMDFPNKMVEAGADKVVLNDNRDDVTTESNVALSTKEAAPFQNPAEVGSQMPTNFHSKKRSRKSLSKNLLGSNVPAHSSEFANEENPKEQLGNDHRGMNKESDTRTTKEAPNHVGAAKLDSENHCAGNVGRSHHKRRRKSEKAETTNFQSNSCEPLHSLENLADKENIKEKLDDQERQQLVVATEAEALANASVLDSGFPTNPTDTKSRRKKKKSVRIEHKDHESTEQDFAHSLVGEVAEDKAKKTMNDQHKELGKEPKLFANHGEAAVLEGSAKVELVVSSSTNDRSTHRRKRKSAKSDLSYNTSGNHDPVHSSGNQLTQMNSEKAPTTTNEYPGCASNNGILPNESEQNVSYENGLNVHSTGLSDSLSNKCEVDCNSAKTDNQGNRNGILGSTSENLDKELSLHMAHKVSAESAEATKFAELPNVDNGKINFIDVFCPSVVQHESVVSAHDLPLSETEPKKQHKGKRKRKSSKHDSTCDLVYPSEFDKQHMAKSELRTSDPCNQDSVDPIDKPSSRGLHNGKANNHSVKRTIDHNMNNGTMSSDFISPQNSSDSRIKEKIQGNKPDTYHQLSLSEDEQSKRVCHSDEKTSFVNNTVNSLDRHDANVSSDLREETHQPEKSEIVNVVPHAVQSQSKATPVIFHKETLPDPAASCDSTEEEETPVQAKQYRLAVRKVPSKNLGKISHKTSLVNRGTIFATSESSEDEFEFRNREATKAAASGTSSSPSDSDGDLENMQTTGFKSAACGGRDQGTDGEDITLSQLSNVSKKGVPLGAILRSSSSYKKAKLLASQSQAEDSESQPIDVVLDSQPDFDGL